MLDAKGHIVGIVRSKIVGFDGLGFATPTVVTLPRLAIAPGETTNITPSLPIGNKAAKSKLLVDPKDKIPPQVCVDKVLCLTTAEMMDAQN